MKILICICTYNRNKRLVECLRYFNKILIPFNMNIKFLIMIIQLILARLNLIKNFKKNSNILFIKQMKKKEE